MPGWSAGRKIGKYELVSLLGEGAACQVWLAVARGPGPFRKDVALKLLKGADDRQKVDLLLREARLTALLHHPSVVTVLEADSDGTDAWIALEYVDGGTVRELISWIKRAGLGLPLTVVLDVALEVARGLQHAHDARDADGQPVPILHRDLKPENVLLDPTGHARLTDFGLASVIGQQTPGEGAALKGTARYVPPEIWRGDRDYRPSSDLFAFGCVLFELITLRRLFDGTMADIVKQIMERDPAKEASDVAHVTPELAPIVGRLLQRDPDDRYQDTADLVADLAALRAERFGAPGLPIFLDVVARLRTSAPVSAPAPEVVELALSPDPRWVALAQAAGVRPAVEEPEQQAPSPIPGRHMAPLLAAVGGLAALAATLLLVLL
jgi:eukaryotic-like serine/threonine-protein kinase